MNFKKKFIILFLFSLSFTNTSNKIAYVYYLEGDSYIKNNNVHLQYKKAIVGRNLYPGDIVKVNDGSICTIFFEDDKTQITIDSNSRIQIMASDLSKEIKIDHGSIYIHNLQDNEKKCYVFTHNNQYFLENDRLWIYSDFYLGDKLYSLDHSMMIYNNINKFSTLYDKNKLHYFFNSGKIIFSNIFENIVPNYVLDKIDENIYEISKISLKKFDLIPIYGDRIRDDKDVSTMKYSYSFGTMSLNSDSYYNFGFHPRYKHNNLTFGFNFEPNFSADGELLSGDWDDFFDIADRMYINYYHRNNEKNNEMYFSYGIMENISFGEGYLLRGLSNKVDYPRLRNSGVLINYKFDNDFMDLKVVIPNFRDFAYSGGIIAARSSLFISHKFPLTLGIGFVADINQLSYIEYQYSANINKNRNIFGLEIDYKYDLFSFDKIDISLYGEVVALWYPEYSYYVIFDNSNLVSDDLRFRKGVWGIKAPGIHLNFNDRIELKISYNYNSALFVPSYFNLNYLTNRTRFYKGELDFPLVDQQIDLLAEYQIEGTTDEYIIPKDLYPILNTNDGFSVYKISGFSTDVSYNITNYLNFLISTSVYIENTDDPNTFYSLETSFNVKDNFIKGISFINLYYSNIFFAKISDKERMSFGLNLGVDLPLRLSLILDIGQVYYDSILIDNNLDQMINTSIGFRYNF